MAGAAVALCLQLAGCARPIEPLAVRSGADYSGLYDQPNRDDGDWAAIEVAISAADATRIASSASEVLFRFHPCKSPGETSEVTPTIGGQTADADAIGRAAAGGQAVRLTGYLEANAWQKIYHPDCMRLVVDGSTKSESASVPLPHPLMFRFVPADANVRDLDDRLNKPDPISSPLAPR